MQEDVPRITQRTAIIYTRCPHSSWTAGDLAASGATPTIRQTPALESLTGFASVSGGYSDSRIRISATSGGALEYTIFSANWGGKIQFDLSAVTSGAVVSGGSAGWLPGSATYPVTVYVYGSDRPYLPRTFYEFPAGKPVDITLTGTVVAPKLMEVAADGASMLNRAGIPAGLQVQATGGDPPTGIRIFGTPEVPGIYTLGAIIRSAEGDPPHYALPFPPGEAEDLVIISIYGDAIAEGDPVVMVPAAKDRADDRIRLVYHAASGAYIAEAATSLYIHSGSAWTATVNSSGGSTSERWTYTLAPVSGGQAWEWGVTYSAAVGEGFPVSETLATAPGRDLGGAWQEIPPKQGWTPEVILQGGGELYLPASSGAFAGVYSLAGSASGATIYEQEPLYTQQYSGWTRPPMIRHSSGAVIVARSGGYYAGTDAAALIISGGVEVAPQTPKNAILPYCPPRCVDCGNGVKWSDPGWLIPTASGATVQAINVSGSDCAIRVNGSAGAGWGGRYPLRRLLPLFRATPRSATFSASKYAASRTISSEGRITSSIEYYDDRGIPRNRTSGAGFEVSSGFSATLAGVSRTFPLDGAVWTSAMLAQEFGSGSATTGGNAGGSMLSQFGSRDFELREAYDVDSGWVIQQDRTIDIISASTGDLRTSSAAGDGARIDAAIYYGDGRDCIDSGGRMFVAVGQGRATGQAGFGGDIVTSYVSSRYDHNGSSIASSGWTSTTSSAGAETFAFSIADLTPHVFTAAAPGFGGSTLISSGEYHGTMDCNGGNTIIYDGGYSRQVDGGLVYNATTRSAWYTEVTTTWHENTDPPGEGWEPWSTTVSSAGSSATGEAAITLWQSMPRVSLDSGFFASGAIGVSGSWIAKYTLYNETETEYRESATLTI